MKRADHQIVQQVLDGSVSKEAFDGFQDRLRGEPELVKLYGDYANLHHSLCEEYEDQAITSRPQNITGPAISSKFFWLAAAAVVLLAATVVYRKTPVVAEPPALMASARFSADAVWSVDGVSRKKGDALELDKGATLKLEQGQARILAGTSASAMIEGPTTLTLVSDGALHLAAGRGRFHLEKADGKLEVSTPSMSALDLGTEFGIDVRPDQPDELHVFDGKVKMRINGRSEGEILTTGEAGRVSGTERIERFPADDHRFLKNLREFKSIVDGRFVKADWRVDYGSPSISEDLIEGGNYAVFLRMPKSEPAADDSVLMATLQVNHSSNGEFHTDGWAGMSFFSQGQELLFFGDSFGPESTWSLDVKQRIPVILPVSPVVGPRTVTLRYDRGTGVVTLHEGELPLGKTFCSGKLPAGLEFDEIRLGASSGAALDVGGLTIRVGGG
ncbi:MAG: hypothetical protein ABIS50_11815 [Luteolibacter sp.]|uniref:hypothetical protein n=1 Tax=Luteolibacter sp. TaxID=1962973 RepID=UPI00326544C3